MTPGELGCFASHYLLWEKCLELNEPIVVIEDDAQLEECFDDSMKKYGGEDIDLSARIWNIYPKSFIFSKNSDSVHFHRRNLSDFCNSMYTYGKYNLPFLIKKYPHYKKNFAADWIFSFKGRLLFNFTLRILISLIIKIYPFQIFIRYLVADAVIRGSRSSEIFS